MTKKDYELIASVIHDRIENATLYGYHTYTDRETSEVLGVINDVAIFMADRLKKQNPKFDAIKFFKACGVK